MKTSEQARESVTAELQAKGWKIAKNAMDPIRRIDFSKLVHIHDHEERFLERTFINTLLALREARVSTNADQGKITADDVETALRMLGTAIARQSNQTLSKITRQAIMDSCGFC